MASPLGNSPSRSTDGNFASSVDFFEKSVRPLLVEHCYGCHSSEAKNVKGGLLLDSKAGWMLGGDSGPAIVPGDPEKSLLIEAVRYDNSDLAMPPKGKLAQGEIDALARWVKEGAVDPRTAAAPLREKKQGLSIDEGRRFWSYRPPVKHPLPDVANAAWPRSGVDHFLLAALEAEGLEPTGDADRATLARRLYFDLIGLPPPPGELLSFLADRRTDAVERLVDRLLDSPRFGERWARHWLDLTRFAESVVLRGLLLKHAWRYRDYAIDAFNQDMPVDQFIREQLAGDLLPGGDIADRRRRKVATSFYSLGDHTLESQDKKQLDMDVVDEQLEVIGKAFLAQTITCARCHDHKFDPIPTRDYYSLAGILRGVDTLAHANVSGWVEEPLPLPPAQERVRNERLARIKTLQKELNLAKKRLAALKPQAAEKGPNGDIASVVAPESFAGIVIDESQATAVGEWTHSQWSRRYIGDGYLHDKAQGKGEKSLTFKPVISRRGRYEVRFAYTPGDNRSPNVPVIVRTRTGERTTVVNEKKKPPIDGRWIRLGHFEFEIDDDVSVVVATTGSTETVTVDAVQLLPIDERGKVADSRTAENSVENSAGNNAESVGESRDEDAERAVETARRAKELETLQLEVKRRDVELKKLKQLVDGGPRTLTVKENGSRDIPIHIRGSVHNLGEIAPRGVLQVTLSEDHANGLPFPADQSGRLQLADWIASPENPLTARVFVNRVWHWLFGAGIVRTPDNFGTMGQRPTHPELLDWLACRFVEEGWSTKWLVRELVLSRAYAMASRAPLDSPAASSDPDNRLLWRQRRRQLEAESLRDAMLASSGQLLLDMGGASFGRELKADYGFRYTKPRRSIYVPVFRNARPEIFEVFDGAHPSMVTGRRDVSTVAPQALFLMNHPFVHEQAERAGAWIAQRYPEVRDGVRFSYLLILGRPPTERELALGERTVGAEADRAKAWARWVHALFNSFDFRYLH